MTSYKNPAFWAKSVLVLICLVWMPLAFATPAMDISGSVPRGSTPKTMSLQITLTSIDQADTTTAGTEAIAFTKKMLGITFPEYVGMNGARAHYDNETTTTGTTTLLPNYLATIQSATLDPITVNNIITYKLVVSLLIDSTNDQASPISALLKNEGNQKVVHVTVTYNGAPLEPQSKAISQTTGVANDVPTNIVVTPAFNSLQVSWQARDSIAFSGTTTSGAPTGVNILVFENTIGIKDMPALLFDANGNDQAASCRFDPSISGACIKCGTNTYLDIPGLQNLGYVKVVPTGPSATPATISDLSPEKTYIVAMSYEPDGIQVSSCQSATPIVNYSLTELNKPGEKASLQDPRCFVATASYGSAYHEYVTTLRWFRNTYLLPHQWGRLAVQFYYRHSPPLAQYIAAHEGWRTVSRGVLWPVVQSVKLLRFSPVLAAVGMMASLAALIALAYRRQRHKKTM